MARPFLDETAAISAPHVLVRVRGEKALEFLHAVSTQDVAGLRPGEGAFACALDDKGRVQAEFRVLVTPDGDVLLDADPESAEAIESGLATISPLSGVTLEIENVSLTAVRGPGTREALAKFEPLPVAEHSVGVVDDAVVVRTTWGLDGFDVIAASMPVVDAPSRTLAEYEAARIVAGVPRFGVDVTRDALINETPYARRAVSFTKGCYPGQESVARVENLGGIRRRLVVLSLDDAELVATAGATVTAGDEACGAVTSAAAGVAMARVRADLDDGVALAVEGAPARVVLRA